VKAVKFLGNKNLEIIDIPKPEPPEGYALIKVMAASICRTDIELLYNNPEKTAVIPGHEIAGKIEKVNKVKDFKTGERVFLNIHITCGDCDFCRSGDWIFCPQLKCIGSDCNGGDAEYMIAPEGILRRLPDDISYELGSLIPDAIGTPYHAVKKAGLKKDDIVGIIGMGPLGLIAVLVASNLGANVFAIDLLDKRLELSRRFGANKVLNPEKNDLKEIVYDLTGGRGLDSVIDCTGSENAIKFGLDILKVRGKFIFVGVCTELTINTYDQIISKEIEMSGSRNFNENELEEIIEFTRKNPKINDIITHRFKFSKAKEAFKIAEERNGIKIILVPQ
jgi:2-desacetyl-2-hydroxyethyl bacteriochlorophyllide A dehydrogenase